MNGIIERISLRRKYYFSIDSGYRRFIRFLSGISEGIFWFFVLLSWIPSIAGLQDILIKLRFGAGSEVFAVRPDLVSFVLIAVFILAAGLMSRLRRKSVVLFCCMLPSLVAVILAAGRDGLETGPFKDFGVWVLPLGLVCVSLSALCFVTHGRLRSFAVVAFIALAAIEALSGLLPLAPEEGEPVPAPRADAASSVFLTFGRLFSAYHISILDLLISASVIILGRFLFLLWVHNRPGLHALQAGVPIRSVVIQTTWLAMPFFVMIGLLGWFWNGVGSTAQNYAITILAVNKDARPDTLEKAVAQASAHERERVSTLSKAGIDVAKNKIRAGSAQSVESMIEVRKSFPDHIMALRPCRWYEVFCHAMNGVKSVVNAIYRKARDAALNALEARLRAIDAQVSLTAAEKQSQATAAVDSINAQSKMWVDTAISKAFETARWVGMILSIYAFTVLVKTVMVIMSRIIYRDFEKNKNFASLRPGAFRSVSAEPRVLGTEFEMFDKNSNIYVVLRYELRNAVANVSIPQPTVGIFGRILSGRYFLGMLRGENLSRGVASIVVSAPSNLVAWELKQGEEIIIRYGDLVAFSSTMKLTTEVNLSLQATLFGRFIFHKICGPGTVVMQTSGEAVAGRQSDAYEARRATSLKAWELYAGFQIQSNLDWRGVYLAPYNIRKQGQSLLIYDSGPNNAKWTPIGLIKSVRTFLLPV